MIKKVSRNTMRLKRHRRIRRKISGSEAIPRLSVFRSNKNIFAQVIDDVNGKTLASASTIEKGSKMANGGNVEAAKQVGKIVAERALKVGIETVVFDRSGYIYHGRIKALAEAAREAGLKF